MNMILDNQLDQSLGPRKFLLLIRCNARFIIGITAATFVAAALLSLVLPVKYRAQALIAARPDPSTNSALGSVQRSLASATGLSTGSDTRSYELIETIRSERLTRDLIESEILLPELFHERWDEQESEWKSDRSVAASLKRLLSGFGSDDEQENAAPSMAFAFEKFDQARTVEFSPKTRLISISIEWSDPDIAADWVNRTIRHTNAYLLNRDERETLSKLDYYKKQVEQESAINIRSNIYQLIQNEYETLATLKAREEYALKTVDPAFVPSRKSRPQRRVIATMGMVLGFLASIGYVVLRDEFRRSESDTV